MGVNKNHVSMREGFATIDGVRVLDCIKLNIVMSPDVWEGRSLGSRGKDRRYLGLDITGSMTEFKSTPWLKKKALEYQNTGKTPEMTIQGVSNDGNSDYYDSYGSDAITLMGAVITGDIPLMDLDTEGDVVQNTIEFGAKYVV